MYSQISYFGAVVRNNNNYQLLFTFPIKKATISDETILTLFFFLLAVNGSSLDTYIIIC